MCHEIRCLRAFDVAGGSQAIRKRYWMRLYKVLNEAQKSAEWAPQAVALTASYVLNRVGEKSHCCVRTSRKAQ